LGRSVRGAQAEAVALKMSPAPADVLPLPGEAVKWYLEWDPQTQQFVAKFEKVKEDEDDEDGGGGLGGRSMTLWWLKLSGAAALNGPLLLAMFQKDEAVLSVLQVVVPAIQGCCAASSLCVGLGYYTAVLCSAAAGDTPSLFYRLYECTGSAGSMSFALYLALDFGVHAIATTSVFVLWRHHLTLHAIFLAFLFHRWWSLWYSSFKTLYLHGDDVYQLRRPLSAWVWNASYAAEFLVLVCLSLLTAQWKWNWKRKWEWEWE